MLWIRLVEHFSSCCTLYDAAAIAEYSFHTATIHLHRLTESCSLSNRNQTTESRRGKNTVRKVHSSWAAATSDVHRPTIIPHHHMHFASDRWSVGILVHVVSVLNACQLQDL